MKKLRFVIVCLLSLFAIVSSYAHTHANDSIYQGVIVKLDLASPILTPAINAWQIQHYELAANVRLKDRFFPTLELGYAGGMLAQGDSLLYRGHGGYGRVGVDINPLKKHPESPHALFIGVRIGTAVQTKGYTDCWGEIVAGCQVNIAAGFYMGWMGRLKFLFTRDLAPIYIPGYGNRDNIGWGINYYLGWKL